MPIFTLKGHIYHEIFPNSGASKEGEDVCQSLILWGLSQHFMIY
jgi:hypothetical protein